ncbi:hypothetical protein [Mycobacterium sp. E2327]|uniref:hypothetical protein n=1 Tax=Mycobacterium sp. E2327 TaxID=1834132 RepID=UPI001E4916F2|nr:hypothetical protein [Mycobacterium sp. E2327]
MKALVNPDIVAPILIDVAWLWYQCATCSAESVAGGGGTMCMRKKNASDQMTMKLIAHQRTAV